MSAPKRSLIDIGDDLRALAELLEETGGEIVDEALGRWFDEIGAERDQKIDRYCGLIDDLDAQAKRHREDAKRLSEWAQVDENKVKRLKERLLWFFEAHKIERLVTPHYKPRIQANGGVQPLNLKVEPSQLPEEFQRVVIEADSETIRRYLEDGGELEFAELLPRGRHLRVK
jgi:hypothetical protein